MNHKRNTTWAEGEPYSPSAETPPASKKAGVETQNTLKVSEPEWQIDGGERIGGINVLPRWSIYTEEFPDISGKTGCGIVSYSKSTFAYLNAEKAVADKIIHRVNAFDDLLEALKRAGAVIENENTSFSPSIRPAVLEILASINSVIAKAEAQP